MVPIVLLCAYTIVVVYSKGHKTIDVVHEAESPKNQPDFSQTTIRQHWLA